MEKFTVVFWLIVSMMQLVIQCREKLPYENSNIVRLELIVASHTLPFPACCLFSSTDNFVDSKCILQARIGNHFAQVCPNNMEILVFSMQKIINSLHALVLINYMSYQANHV